MAALQAAGVPSGAVLDVAEVFRDPQLLHREAFAWQPHPEMGPFPHSRTAWRSRRAHQGVAGPAPLYGEANAYALTLLGEPAHRVAALTADGVLATEPRGG